MKKAGWMVMTVAWALLVLWAPAVQAETFKIGVIMPQTGQLSLDGTHETHGVKFGVEDVNAKGGVKVGGEKYTLETIVYDDQGIPKESIAAMEKLVSRDKVKMVVGAYTSSSTFAIMPIAEKEKVILCSGNSAAEKLTEVGNKWFFRGGPTSANAVGSMTKYVKKLGFKSLAHVAINDDWGRNTAAINKEHQEKVGVKVVTQEFYEHGTSDFYSILTKIKGLKPEAIFLITETKACSILIRQAREVCPEIPLLESGGSDPYLLLKLSPQAAEGMYVANRGPELDNPKIAPLVTRYRDKYKGDPMSYVWSGYDVLMMFVQALERAGTVTDTEKIREAMTKTNYQGLMGHYFFNEKNNNSLDIWIGEIKGGKVHLWTP
jgi:branched-chain amino acid transport system substrate-binding protein